MGSGLDQCLSPAQRADLDRRKIRTLRGIPDPPDPSSCTKASWIRQKLSLVVVSCAPAVSRSGYAGDRSALRDRRPARRGRLDTERVSHRKIASGSIAATRNSTPIRCYRVPAPENHKRGPAHAPASAMQRCGRSRRRRNRRWATYYVTECGAGIAPRSGRLAGKACRQLASFSTILGKINWVRPKGAATSLPARMETQTWAILTAVSSGTS
jgi:hypothetical protein